MTETTLFRKSVILRPWDIQSDVRNFCPVPGVSIGYSQIDKDNLEAVATLTGAKTKIERTLSKLPVVSERFRQLKNVPKWRIVNTKKIRVQ